MTRNSIEAEVLSRVLPTDAERAAAQAMGEKLIAAVYEAANVPAMMTGSVARGTWVRGDKDIDIFMLFPPELSREELQEKGLAAAYAVVEKFSGTAEEKYAEHPYLNAVIEGFDVDLVPCYHVASTAEMKCAVDRTPFHTRYLLPKIAPLREDVLLLKQFAKGGGVYGSDHMTGGFSGYLCELLILAFGGFSEFMQAASKFRYGEVIDIEKYYPDAKTVRKKFSEPLVVIDPTDRDRNVAAALTPTRFAEFMELARDYCAAPSPVYFLADPPTQMGRGEFAEVLEKRGTAMLAIRMKTPPYVADTVVPQLRKSMESIRSMLVAEDFQIHRAEKYLTKGEFAGPWIEEDRYYTEVRRKYTTARSLLEDAPKILSGALGKHVRQVMEESGYEVLSGTDIWSAEFSFFLSAFFARSSHAIRKLREIGQTPAQK